MAKVTRCPFAMGNTGRPGLQANKVIMEQEQEKKFQADIEVTDMGPIKITGNFVIKDLKRNAEYSQGEFLLCGCGKSANKPFCDDSHKK